jgi:hypothetical protein
MQGRDIKNSVESQLPKTFDTEEDAVDEAGGEGPQHRCIDCKTLAPRTQTAHTLISVRYGWRLRRWQEVDGTWRLEWRCPPCAAANRTAIAKRPERV